MIMKSGRTMPHALIIGGTRGLGRTTTDILSERGFSVSVVGRRDVVDNDKIRTNVHYWVGDLSDQDNLTETLEDIIRNRGEINYLIFCQRYRGAGDPWIGEFNVSLSLTKAIIEFLQERFDPSGDRSIVLVSSVFGDFVGEGQSVAYHVCKSGLNQMMRYYAVTLARRGIRVNAVTPFTFLKEESKDFYLSNKPLLSLYEEIVPLGRMPTATDSARLISFLCSTDSTFINGQNIYVDGGLSLLWQESLARGLSGL